MKYLHIISLFLLFAGGISAQPTIPNPAQRDTIFLDLGTPNQADPGDKIRYKVTIQNTGNAAATMAQIIAGLDPRTTFIPGSFRTSPLATPDAYAVTGNVGINVPDGAGDLLSNDFDDNVAGLTITTGTFATTGGGSIMINADGSFMYTPPPGFTGSDTYTYTLHDGNAVPGVTPTDMGLITFTISNLIYFIDNASAAATSDGRLTSPYKTLADFNAGSATAASVVYINHTGTNYTGGIVLANGERLFGEGHTGAANLSGVLPFTLAPNSKTLPNINGSRPVIENAGGDGILLASNNIIRGLNVGASTDMAIDDNGSVGTLTISELSINNISGGGIRADNNGTLAVTLDALTATGGPHAVNLNSTGGTFTITGATNATGQTSDAIILTGVSATVSFATTNITPTGAFQAIEITNNTGAISFASGTVGPGSTAEEVLIHQGNANITFGCTVTGNSGGTIKITGRTGGMIDFTNNVTHNAGANGIVIGTSTAGENNSGGTIQFSGPSKGIASSGAFTGVLMTSNTGATINFINGGLNIDCLSASGVGMSITGGGSLTVSGNTNTIDVQPGIAFLNSGTGGNATIDVNAALTSSSGKVVDIQNRTGGNVTLSGNLSSVGSGILVNGNSGGTILFSGTSKTFNSGGISPVNLTSNSGTTINFTNGGLVITTSTGVGFNATGGAAGISVQGSNNTINSTNGVALNVANTSINSGNLTFISISSGNNDATADPANGIVLNATGSSGGLIVSGTGTAGTGGVIQSSTASGIFLNSCNNINLSYLNVINCNEDGIEGTSVTNLNLTGNVINNNGDDSEDCGIGIDNMWGTCNWSNLTVTASELANVFIHNTSNVLTAFNITGASSFSNLGTAFGGNSILVECVGTAILTEANINGATISNNKPARGITVQAQFTGGSNSQIGDAISKAFVVQNCAFTGNGLHASFEQSGAASLTFKFLNNGTAVAPMTIPLPISGTSHALNVASSSTSTGGSIIGTISNNFIGNSSVASSGSPIGNGLRVFIQGKTDATLLINGNTIRQTPQARGIDAQFLGPLDASGAPVQDITITNNDVNPQDNTGFPTAAIYVAGDSQGGGNVTVRTDVRGNIVPAGAAVDVLSTFIIVDKVLAAATVQLVDNPVGPGGQTPTQQLQTSNTGSAGAQAGVTLITGPINVPF